MRSRLPIALLLTALLPPLIQPAADATVPDAAAARLEVLVPEVLAREAVPGAAVALVRDGRLVWSEGFGVRNTESGEPLGAGDVFEAASLGKPVFARLVLDLADVGAIDLERPLVELMPDPFVPAVPRLQASEVLPDPRLAEITPRLVLSQRTGFPNWGRGKPLALAASPGERFGYSGEGYQFLQRVVEHLTGSSVGALAAERLFAPLGMVDSGFSWRESYAGRAATGHDGDNRPTAYRRFEEGGMGEMVAGSLYTTAADYARFLAASLADERFLEQVTPVEEGITWGLGWAQERTTRGTALWHWGDNDEFKSMAFGYPETGDGVVVLTNGLRGLRVARAVVETVFPGDHPALRFWMVQY